MRASPLQQVITFALVAAAHVASAQEAPSLGILYNTQETNSLTYRCSPVRAGQLDCEFTQTAVRFKSTASQLSKVIEQARKQFRSEKPPSREECSSFHEMLAVLEGKKPAPNPEGFASMSPIEKSDALHFAKSFIEYCEKPTEESFLNIVKAGHEKDSRTCSASSNTYKQSFRFVTEATGGSVWVTQSTPEGPCGIVQLSRFESETTKIGSSNFSNWKYIARKAITNPSAEFFPGAKCSGLDEAPYTYDWRSKEHQMTCSYIQFSPI